MAALTALMLLTACDATVPTAVAPSGPVPKACSGIDDFEELVRNTGIVYNYQPSRSVEHLAEWSDAVVAGTLVAVKETPGDLASRGITSVTFTVDVDRVIRANPGLEVGERLTFITEFNVGTRDAAEYKQALPEGAMTVLFLSEWHEEWTPHLEGFWFACGENDPPGNGLTEPNWTVKSLGSLIETVEEPVEIKPEPSPTTADLDSEPAGEGRLKIRPRSADVAGVGTYRFTVPHCGLDWMVDFDASFWKAEHPDDYGKGNRYPFFYNPDVGTFTFVSWDRAIYEASTGDQIRLRRLDGRIVITPCM
ncbi:MAG: hypothetical protein GEU71_09775 [Actinobacteria bacterium]|nr:hypothetical protein [Actinomycetota bacterium]